ncbi:MAG: adenylate kinase [Bdellovibrionales bacterium RIFCSPHIGHO2_01_FULL_40_29]|nr:MAG: adenylate kinase [Bdellovibrionales bacterium RIFCSPHIGHO2_01_FULL_40_29]OFZ33900.1 MAG: adenylate kinase [Bdellovibrionales bacterium RIFCSPHIGHO2_02_FULL_40_15]
MNVILIGAPGSGKGTQSRYLIDKHQFLQLSTGDLLRGAIAEKTEIGLMAQGFMDQGKLVPDEVMVKLVESFIDKNKGKSVIFDGFPRTVAQAESLEQMLKKSANQIDKVIFFSIDSELLVSRLTGRRTCAKCGEIYHIETKPSSKGEVCEKCGGELRQRPDDKKEVIGERLAQFEKNTGPTINFYRGKNMLEKVDCAKDPEIVLEEIEEILGLA